MDDEQFIGDQLAQQLRERTRTAVIVDCSCREAWALAELAKRITWAQLRELAVDDQEAQAMVDAVERLRRGLYDSGFRPR